MSVVSQKAKAYLITRVKLAQVSSMLCQAMIADLKQDNKSSDFNSLIAANLVVS